MPRRRPRKIGRKMRAAHLAVVEDVNVTTADIAVNSVIYTVSGDQPVTISIRVPVISLAAGNASSSLWSVIRRVPRGTTAPSAAIASGDTSFLDAPNVLSYYMANLQTGTRLTEFGKVLKSSCVFFPGDTLVFQSEANTASGGAAHIFNAQIGFTVG